MVFVDGLGMGQRYPTSNPLCVAQLPALRSMLGGEVPLLDRLTYESELTVLLPLDATLGVDGLPQSGTGQTALFTGVNGAKVIGKHFGPYPYSTLRPIIAERNIFRQLLDRGKSVAFANAFPQRFFEYILKHPSRRTVTTLSYQSAGLDLMRDSDLEAGVAVSADITGEGWMKLGYPDIVAIEPEAAGERLARLARQRDFVLFEYWLTDRAGHAQDMPAAVEVLERFDRMLAGVIGAMDKSDTILLITSDHGNMEDLSTKSHTRNPVLLILYGDQAPSLASAIGSDLTSITPFVVKILCDS
jgi:2,3-bisphosphoglycerate-independent phosphoglycerate mutase